LYNKDYLFFIDLMNQVSFGVEAEKIDANFISIYNPNEDDFDYYVERLVGVPI